MKYSSLDLRSCKEDRTRIHGVPSGYDAHVLLDLQSGLHKKLVYICADESHLRNTASALSFIRPEATVLEFPPWDCPPFSRISPNSRIVATRIKALSRAGRAGPDQPVILLTTPNAAMQRLAPAHVFSRSMFIVHAGRTVDSAKLAAYFHRIGLERVIQVMEPGEFAVRGGIVDVFPPGYGNPLRLDFFGHTVESIREFRVADQRTIRQVGKAEFIAASEVLLDEASIENFRSSFRREFGASSLQDQVYGLISAGLKFQGMEQWLPFFYRSTVSLVEYLPDAAVITMHDLRQRTDTWWNNIMDLHADRTSTTRSGTAVSPVHACPPHWQYLEPARLDEILGERVVYAFHQHKPDDGSKIDGMGRTTLNMLLQRHIGHAAMMDHLKGYIGARRAENKVVIACRSDGSLDRVRNMLSDEGIDGAVEIDGFGGFIAGGNSLGLARWPLEQGYEYPGVTVISEQDIFGSTKTSRATRKRRQVTWVDDPALNPGELVVHADHGIGRYVALQKHRIDGLDQDFVVLEYAEGSRLSIPVENMDLLTRYGSDRAPLDRLGAAAWQERRSRLKKRLLDIAKDLMHVAAEREMQSAPVLLRDNNEWDSFVARFEYQETEDQEAAIEELIADLESSNPMDRLICGDVGFGKTEVAMRAAFVAAMAGYQVAVLAPTTLLSRQHHDTFMRRFRGFPVEIRQLSRLTSRADAAEARSGLADGTVDIVVGTHTLLGRSITFSNLGLLIVDEEQNFGVVQKERIKRLQTRVHVLTLTATPIPRTLQQALSGIRDMSMILTPPVDRLVIRTYVTPFDPVDVRQALLREMNRGGQSFVVVPRIRDIPAVEEFLVNQVPEANYSVANGRMSPVELEEQTRKFYDGECNILLSTNIIASGLDIPTANTIVIINAYRFGLSQLYQLRGRVGRSHLRAYAYITYPGEKRLSATAEARLRALNSIEDLGAGLRVSVQDLDIRGAGNLLGSQQSGHVTEVGVELYNKMLEEAVLLLKSGDVTDHEQADVADWTPQLNIGVEARIPEEYIPDADIRIGIYRRMARLTSVSEIEEMSVELADRFGRMPEPLQMFVRLLAIKSACKSARISSVDWTPFEVVIKFLNNAFPNPDALMEHISRDARSFRIRKSGLCVRRRWTSESGRVAGIYSIVRDIAGLVSETGSQ